MKMFACGFTCEYGSAGISPRHNNLHLECTWSDWCTSWRSLEKGKAAAEDIKAAGSSGEDEERNKVRTASSEVCTAGIEPACRPEEKGVSEILAPEVKKDQDFAEPIYEEKGTDSFYLKLGESSDEDEALKAMREDEELQREIAELVARMKAVH